MDDLISAAIASLNWGMVWISFLLMLFIVASIAVTKNFIYQTSWKNKSKKYYPLVSYLIGGVIGVLMYDSSNHWIDFFAGCVAGYFAPVVYRVFLKQLFKRTGIEVRDGTSDYPSATNNNKQ